MVEKPKIQRGEVTYISKHACPLKGSSGVSLLKSKALVWSILPKHLPETVLLSECKAEHSLFSLPVVDTPNIQHSPKVLPSWSAAAAAMSLQSCLTLCDPIDGSPPDSPVSEILQARTLEPVAISFSNAWKWKVKVKSSVVSDSLATPWTAAHHAPPSMVFFRQEY